MIHTSFDSDLEADSGNIFIFLNEIVKGKIIVKEKVKKI